MTKARKKPRLLPVLVPWEVSASTPFLRLFAFEGGTTQVKMVVEFGSLGIGALPVQPAGGSRKVLIVDSPDGADPNLSPEAQAVPRSGSKESALLPLHGR